MGLFWSMIQEPGQHKGRRILKRDVTTPLDSHIFVLRGTVPEKDILTDDNESLCSTVCHRSYMAEGVSRTEVRAGRLSGTLFIPPGMKCNEIMHEYVKTIVLSGVSDYIERHKMK